MIIQGFFPKAEAIAGLPGGLKNGDSVTVKVLKAVAEGWDVSVRGARFHVKADTPLFVGREYTARVAIHGRSVVFHTQNPQAPVADFLRGAGIPDDGISRLLVQAFRLTGLSLKPDIILQLRNILKKTGHRNALAARIAVILHDKGLDPSPELIDYIYELGKEGYSGRKGHERRERDDRKPDEDIHGVIKQGTREDPLHLFNHFEGSEDHWVLVPFRAGEAAGNITGSLRLRFARKTESLLEAHVFCESEERSWWFRLPVSISEGAGISMHTNKLPEGRAARRELEKLRQKLHNLGVKVDDIIKVDSRYEGMTAGEYVADHGVDTYV